MARVLQCNVGATGTFLKTRAKALLSRLVTNHLVPGSSRTLLASGLVYVPAFLNIQDWSANVNLTYYDVDSRIFRRGNLKDVMQAVEVQGVGENDEVISGSADGPSRPL